MLRLILLVITVAAGLAAGPLLKGQQGYVLISTANSTIETSIPVLIFMMAALFIGIILVLNILKFVFSLFGRTRGFFDSRKQRKSREQLAVSQAKLLEGDWKQAEKLAVKYAPHSDNPQLNFLTAAQAAQGRGDVEQRNKYLIEADASKGSVLAVNLTRARLQLEQNELDDARHTLETLRDNFAQNGVVLGLLRDCYLAQQDYQPLVHLLPALKKAKLMDDAAYEQLCIEAECGVMGQIASLRGSEGLLSYWHSLKKAQRQNPVLLASFVKEMISRQADEQAYTIIKETLKKVPSPEIMALIPQLKLTDYHPVITMLNGVLKNQADNAVAFSTLGQLYLRDGKLEEAKAQFEKAVELSPNVSDYAYLADVHERLKESDKAAEISRKGLLLATPNQA
uniref:heme biosynthesis HemY N-terminal domain-containing protein n=1 Tax=Thaumasiovibrio occultus TaxID=1891184 RepID=UPI000B355E0C|nr:heme biosynthesis HemY N-terminal domain-containing protein [Thaumasiovibrio occultus]